MQFLLMRQGTARPKKMQSSRGKKLHRTPPLPSMEEIKCQLHHPRKEAEPVPDEPCRNELVTSRDTSGHFRVFASPPSVRTAPFLSPALRILHAILHANCRLFLLVFFLSCFFFLSLRPRLVLEQGHVASVCQICSGQQLHACLPYKV